MSPEQKELCSPPLTSAIRLSKVDQLREKNIGTLVPLPQLVAVGDQSSGKSSLLESLCGIPFPRGQELCTRYATQITHRREASQRIEISIIPGPRASEPHKEKLSSYGRQVQTTAQLRQVFPEVLAQVNVLMGINTAANPDREHTFSEDILKIEKCGPDEDYLTIIDVPGIFRNTTEGVTTNKDKQLVKDMVKRYIKDSRTIILAVLPSNVDVATQEILTLAEEVDPTGNRTLGILTKADLLKERTAKSAVVNLVEGNRKPLKLGYHIVTNRGGDDHGDDHDTSGSLIDREAMFLEQPWNTLPGHRLGVYALRDRLEDLLGGITDRAFPELRTEIRQRLADAEKMLKDLGACRGTEREQQQYLVGVASDFQALVRAALDANYSAHPAFAGNELRLITAVVNTTDQFNSDFDQYARTYFFESENQVHRAAPTGMVTPPSPVFPADHEGNDDGEKETDDGGDDVTMNLDGLQVPDPEDFIDLETFIVKDWAMEPPRNGIMQWIEAVYHRSRGLDLGSPAQEALRIVFREQSKKWEMMTKQYISKVILFIHRFIFKALEVVCTDKQVFKSVSSEIMDDLCVKYQSGMSQGTMLAEVERQLKPYTLNHYYNHNRQRSYGGRVMETLRPKARHEHGKSWSSLIVNLSDVPEAITNKSNAAYTKESIHDNLEAYYKVAYKRFVDNVFSQAVDYKLLSGPESPLRLFSEQWVLRLDRERLLSVAGESRQTRAHRETLQKKIHDLEDAMSILR